MEKKILNQLCITEYEIIGSYADKNISREVVSDIDTQDIEIFNNDDIATYNKILEHFRDVFKKYKDNKSVVITDFKCGVDKANVPIRWKYNDIMRGYTYLDENKKASEITEAFLLPKNH
jgi:predicted nucleotide-binding protein (sugar kinase/HSP70/actin superfamily)